MTKIENNFIKWPYYSSDEREVVDKILRSGKVNYLFGEEGREFEIEFSSYINSNYSITLANGTLALDLALKALNIGPGDEVIVTPRSFIASVSSVVNIGAIPIFADIDLDSGNINPETIRSVLSKKTKAIICVHLAGWPCDMPGIMKLAKQYKLKVIEDCAQAHGAKIGNKHVGTYGDVGTWSFCSDKIMSTGGEGGLVSTNSKKLWKTMWSFKDHGKNHDTYFKKSSKQGFRWVHDGFGSNFRMTEMQSAIARLQLRKLDSWSKKRSKNAQKLSNLCLKYNDIIRLPKIPDNFHHAYYKFYAYVREESLKRGWSRDRIIEEINDLGVPCFSGSCSEIYLEKAFKGTDLVPKIRLKNAKKLGETSIMFLVHPTLSNQDMKLKLRNIETVFQKAS